MKRYLKYVILLLTSYIAVSCMRNDIDADLAAAENAMANNDYALAQDICNTIASRDSLNDLSATQLCRLSIVYLELSDHLEQGANVGIAANCYHRAVAIEPDSAFSFYQSLPMEKEGLAHMLWVLDRSRDGAEIPVEFVNDSIEFDAVDTDSVDMRYIEQLRNNIHKHDH